MSNEMLLSVLLFCQIVVVSLLIPKILVNRVRYVMETYPRATYPKLYPVSEEKLVSALLRYQRWNLLVAVLGLVILTHYLGVGAEELLSWDSQSVLILYFMVQWSPFLLVENTGRLYLRMLRSSDQRRVRSANLKRRGVGHYLAPKLVVTAILFYILFIGVVVYVARDPFPGFAGYWNILFVALLNLFLLAVFSWSVHGRKPNPFLTAQDQERQLTDLGRLMLWTSILVSVKISLSILLPGLGLRHYTDHMMVFYFIGIALLILSVGRVRNLNFEVFRAS